MKPPNTKEKIIDTIVVIYNGEDKCFNLEPFTEKEQLCYNYVNADGFTQQLHIIGKWGNNDFVASLNNECFYITKK